MKKKYYHKPGSVATFWSNNYIKYESNSDNNNSNRKKHYRLENTLIRLHHT